jgi:hypothetical protein
MAAKKQKAEKAKDTKDVEEAAPKQPTALWLFETYSERVIFDAIKRHLLRQGKPSKRQGIYAYRGDDGCRCPGGLVLGEHYKEDFEDKTWLQLVINGFVPAAHKSLICRFQKIHDRTEPALWSSKIEEFEREFFAPKTQEE